MPLVGWSKYHGYGVDIPWVWGEYTMDRGIDVPWVVRVNIPWVGWVDLSWVGGSIFHG